MQDQQPQPWVKDGVPEQQVRQALEVLEAVGPWPPGHFGSPYPSQRDVDRAKKGWANPSEALPGIDLNVDGQLSLVERLGVFRDAITLPPSPSPGWRFSNDNPFFGNADALALYAMIRELRPRRIIEVGSGFSSALMLDVNERFCDGGIDFLFIEPYPDRLHELLRPADLEQVQIATSPVQEIPLNTFDSLEAGDILFIDSSHVVKMGSDVNYLYFEVLPRLKRDVHVLIHDIFYPFEYPSDWLEKRKIAWSEGYLLRAFLQYSNAFEISLFCDYLLRFHAERVRSHYPELARGNPGSIWMRRAA
jgi:Methyltransferase domain